MKKRDENTFYSRILVNKSDKVVRGGREGGSFKTIPQSMTYADTTTCDTSRAG
jgi:hypothetical protein